MLVADASHAWVQAFDKASGQFLARFGGKGDADHQLDKPEGIAVDPDGNIAKVANLAIANARAAPHLMDLGFRDEDGSC